MADTLAYRKPSAWLVGDSLPFQDDYQASLKKQPRSAHSTNAIPQVKMLHGYIRTFPKHDLPRHLLIFFGVPLILFIIYRYPNKLATNVWIGGAQLATKGARLKAFFARLLSGTAFKCVLICHKWTDFLMRLYVRNIHSLASKSWIKAVPCTAGSKRSDINIFASNFKKSF